MPSLVCYNSKPLFKVVKIAGMVELADTYA